MSKSNATHNNTNKTYTVIKYFMFGLGLKVITSRQVREVIV
jgi:hypothetical protein